MPFMRAQAIDCLKYSPNCGDSVPRPPRIPLLVEGNHVQKLGGASELGTDAASLGGGRLIGMLRALTLECPKPS
jgi:hypothetical protein